MAVDLSSKANRVRRLTLQLDNPTNRAPQTNAILVPTILADSEDFSYLIQLELKSLNPSTSTNEVVSIPSDANRTIQVDDSQGQPHLVKEAQFTNTGTDGLIEVEIKLAELAIPGNYQIYGTLSGSDWRMTSERGSLIIR